MKAMGPETMPQESMVRAIQIRAPTRRGGGNARIPLIKSAIDCRQRRVVIH
jgi:hypothetical protein